jgi:hypothetical protein
VFVCLCFRLRSDCYLEEELSMSAPHLSSSTTLIDDGDRARSAFHRTERHRGAPHPHGNTACTIMGTDAAHQNSRAEVKRSASSAATPSLRHHLREHQEQQHQHQYQRQQHQRRVSPVETSHPHHSIPPRAAVLKAVGLPSATLPAETSTLSLNASTHSQPDSVTSSQYLCAIQQDLEALVQLQQRQLLGTVEKELQQQQALTLPETASPLVQRPQQQQPQQKAPTSAWEVMPKVPNKLQLKSIDSVKQALIHDTSHLFLSPPPPMPAMVESAPDPAATDVLPHHISDTSLLPRRGAGEVDGSDGGGDTAPSARIAALPPPPPSSSPIPASLVEYHAYLMQLEHQQRQHFEVLRRQRKLKSQSPSHSNGHARPSPLKGSSGSVLASATPPRQRMHGAEAPVFQDRRDRSPPLALMLRSMRHRSGARDDSPGSLGYVGGAAVGNMYHRWSDAYTDDNDEEEEEGGVGLKQRSGSRGINAVRRAAPPQRVAVSTSSKPSPVGHQRRDSAERQRQSPAQADRGSASLRHSRKAQKASPAVPRHRQSPSQRGDRWESAQRPSHSHSHRPSPSHHHDAMPPPQAQPRGPSHSRRTGSATKGSVPPPPHTHTPTLQHPRQHLVAAPQMSDSEGTVSLTEVSPIKPILSLLPRELGVLSQPGKQSNSRPLMGPQTSSSVTAAEAAVYGTTTTPSSSPVEAFADALLLDTSGDAVGQQHQQQHATAASLAAVTAASTSTQPQVMVSTATRSAVTAGTAMTTTTKNMVGGTAAMHEAITFSIAPGGLVMPIYEAHQRSSSGGSSNKTPQNKVAGSPSPAPQSQLLADAAHRGADVFLNNTATSSRSPDRHANGTDTTAVGQGVAAVVGPTSPPPTPAAAAATTASTVVNNTSTHHPRRENADVEGSVPYDSDDDGADKQRGRLSRRRCNPAAAPAATPPSQGATAGPGHSFSYLGGGASPLSGLTGGQRERHHHHHHHRRSYEGISSMIPEHGTGTPRSSRYRNNSTGTAGAGVRGSHRRHWPVEYDALKPELEVEEEKGEAVGRVHHHHHYHSGSSRNHDNHDDEDAPRDTREAMDEGPPLQPRSRRVPQHRNTGEDNGMIIVTENAPQWAPVHLPEEAAEHLGEGRRQRPKSLRRRAAAMGENTNVSQALAGSVSIPKPPWRSVRALTPTIRRSTSRQAATTTTHAPRHAQKSSVGGVAVADVGEAATARRVAEPPTAAAAAAADTAPHQRVPSPQHPSFPQQRHSHSHSHSRRPPPSAAAVWHELRRMWASAPAQPSPFAPAHCYHHPRSPTAAAAATVVVSALQHAATATAPPQQFEPPLPGPTVPLSTCKDPQSLAVGQTSADATAEERKDGAVVAAAAPPPPAAGKSLSQPSSPPSAVQGQRPRKHVHAARLSHAPPAAVAASASAAAAASALFCMTDSLIGAALQDVLPVCKARQREVAREVDRRRYQLTDVVPSPAA